MSARVLAVLLVLAVPVAAAAAPPDDSIAALRAAALKGDPEKQYELSERYAYGIGIQKDDAGALT